MHVAQLRKEFATCSSRVPLAEMTNQSPPDDEQQRGTLGRAEKTLS